MEQTELTQYFSDMELTDYMPLPRQLFSMGLTNGAILTYTVLLDRGTLSRKSGFTDEAGWVYVIYPLTELADTLGISDSQVKRNLQILERKGLLKRTRPVGNGVSFLFLYLPRRCIKATPPVHPCTPARPRKHPPTVHKGTVINIIEQPEKNNNYYQHKEDSL